MKKNYKLNSRFILAASFVLCLLNLQAQVQYSVVPAGGTAGNTNGTGADPVCDYYTAMRYQVVYTAAELTAAGIQAGTSLTNLAWNVTELPGTLGNYTINIGHTSAANSAVHDASPTTEVKAPFNFTPVSGYNDILFDVPFVWNGTDNLLINICTGPSNPYLTPYGGVEAKTGITNASRSIRRDNIGSQCGANTETASDTKPYLRLTGTPPPAAPATPTQDPATPTCSGGTSLSATGTPPAGDSWYWQTTATGTSTSLPASSPYVVFFNGTYYIRAYNSGTGLWSATTSIVISNFPLAPTPPAPLAAANPACVPGTTVSVPTPPAGFTYYWQTAVNGTSTANNASAPLPVPATGTYYVANYDNTSQCWSLTSSVTVTVNSFIPATPTITTPDYFVCTGATTAMIEVSTNNFIAGTLATTQAGGNGCTNGNMFDITAGPLPVTLTSFDLTPYASGAQSVGVYYKTGSYLGNETTPAAWTLLGTYNITGTVATLVNMDCADLIVPAGQTYSIYINYNAQYTTIAAPQTYSNSDLSLTAGAGLCTLFSGVNPLRAFNGVVHYTTGSDATTSWFNAPTGGTEIGSGSPFETVGTSLISSPAPQGTYNFYPASYLDGCYSTHANAVTVHVSSVNVELTPIDATCYGATDGSFTVSDTLCGTTPFTYAVDGGAFGPIPANLTAGEHTVVVQDAASQLSGEYTITIIQPLVPQELDAFNIGYFNGQLTWEPQGSETSWIVNYGPAGFDPETEGETVAALNDTISISDLEANTNYEFYVTADCGASDGIAGPFAFSTDPGFFTFDNACGPGFTDISTTGTPLNLADDGAVVVTSSFPLSVQGVTSDQINISNNGFISFGGVTLNAWNLDLDSEEGNVYYQTVDIGGVNYFIVQWDDRPRFSAVAGQLVTFQLLVNQATGEVYYIYDDVVFGGSQSGNDYGLAGTISAVGPLSTVTVSSNNATYLTNNSCVHFYNTLCPNPTNLVLLPFETEAQLSWNAGLYGETEWTVVYGPAGFELGVEGDTISPSPVVTNTVIEDLEENTQYDVYIFSECAADGLTSESGLFGTFLTKPFCANPISVTVATDVDSLESAWNWNINPIDIGYELTGFNIEYGMTGFEQGTGEMVVADGLNFSDTIVDTDFLAGGVYQMYIQATCGTDNNDSVSAFVGPFAFTMPLSNDDVCTPQMLAADGTVYTFNNSGATVGAGEAAIAPLATGAQTTDGWINSTLNNTVWFTFVAPASGNVRVNSTAINYNGQAAVYEVSDCEVLTTFELLAANDNAIGSASVAPNYTICGLTPGSTYYLLYDGFNTTTGLYSLSISPISLEAGAATPTAEACSEENVDLNTIITGEQAGGVWSSDIAAVNSSITGSDLETAGLAFTTFTLQYRVTDGCAFDSILSNVQVFGPSSAGTDGTITVCRNQPTDLLAGLGGNVDHEGTWYDPADVILPNSQISASNVPGNYSFDYIAGNGVCPNDTSLVVVVVSATCDFLDLNEEIFSGVEVFPNPSEGIVFITSDLGFSYEVTDANGRVITQKTNGVQAAQKNEINLSSVETGVYFIRLNNEDAQKTYRVVIR